MLLKRSFVLAGGILLFIVAYIVYFDISKAQMEDRFKAEREKFNVQGAVLTTSEPPEPAAPAASPASATDTNSLIGPVPPSSSSSTDGGAGTDTNAAPAMDTNAAPSAAPAPADSNSAPVAPTSTMIYPHASRSVFQLASFRPSDSAVIPMADSLEAQSAAAPAAPAMPVASPAATPPATPAPAASAASSAANAATSEGSVIVLLYHQFKPAGVAIPAKFQWTMNQDVFESEMKYIHDNGYNVIPMAQLLKFIKHEGTVPPKAVVITIDDGYKSAVVYAAPILKKYGYPWTFFIYPDFVTVAEGSGAVSWNDLLQLQAEGIDIESHSMTHPNLKLHKQKIKGVWQSLSPDQYAAWLNNETAGAKAELEQKMGKQITCFAYPYGEYNTQVEAAAVAAGYEAIFTVADNPVRSTTSLHSIGRYTITQGVEKNFTAYLRQGALGLSSADPAPGATVTNPRPIITAALGYSGTLDPNSIETSVRDFGDVRHDFDPKTNIVRLYLPRDLIQPVVLVNIRVRDASTGQVMVANWHFNYEPDTTAAPAAIHQPITSATNAPAVAPKIAPAPAPQVAPAPAKITIPAPAPATSAPAAPLAAPAASSPPAQPQTPTSTHD